MSSDPGELYAVIGHPIHHSLSPFIHRQFAEQTGEHLSYGAVDISPATLALDVQALFDNGYRGLNVTMPHKSSVMALCDEVSERVRLAGAANTLIWDGERLRGETTDGLGLLNDLQDNLGFALQDAKVLIVGAGGSTYSILGDILDCEPAQVLVANRNAQRAHDLVEYFACGEQLTSCALPDIPPRPFNLVLNATSASLSGARPEVPAACVDSAFCYDLMYAAQGTPFTAWCHDHGARAVHTGIGMLVAQAAYSFELWRGVRPDMAPVRAALGREFGILY